MNTTIVNMCSEIDGFDTTVYVNNCVADAVVNFAFSLKTETSKVCISYLIHENCQFTIHQSIMRKRTVISRFCYILYFVNYV